MSLTDNSTVPSVTDEDTLIEIGAIAAVFGLVGYLIYSDLKPAVYQHVPHSYRMVPPRKHIKLEVEEEPAKLKKKAEDYEFFADPRDHTIKYKIPGTDKWAGIAGTLEDDDYS